jgi:hypothetical protein
LWREAAAEYNNRASKSVIFNIFEDVEVVKNGKVKFVENARFKKREGYPRRTWYRFYVHQSEWPVGVA